MRQKSKRKFARGKIRRKPDNRERKSNKNSNYIIVPMMMMKMKLYFAWKITIRKNKKT